MRAGRLTGHCLRSEVSRSDHPGKSCPNKENTGEIAGDGNWFPVYRQLVEIFPLPAFVFSPVFLTALSALQVSPFA